MAYERQGTFDDLNNALFAQMERLANAESDADIKREIERSEAVSGLACNIIGNAKNAIEVMKCQQREGMDMAGMVATRPKLLGGPPEVRKIATPQEVADPWIADNASEHTVTYMADRLGWTYEEVVSACDRLGVSAKSADDVEKRSWRKVRDDRREKTRGAGE